jgi:hypothetical protein
VKRWLRHNVKWVILTLVLAAVWAQSFNGRVDAVNEARADCQRGIVERFGNMENWYAAYTRATAQGVRLHEDTSGVDLLAAASYLQSVRVQMEHVDAKHSLMWPDPRTEPGPYEYPLGYGTFSCHRAYPDADPFEFFGPNFNPS